MNKNINIKKLDKDICVGINFSIIVFVIILIIKMCLSIYTEWDLAAWILWLLSWILLVFKIYTFVKN